MNGKNMFRTLLLILFLSVSSSAHACKCEYKTVQENFERAENVYHVQVREIKLIEKASTEEKHVIATYKVLEVFKGQNETEGTALLGLGNCSPGLYPGHNFVLFISKTSWVSKCTGTFNTNMLNADYVRKNLDELKRLSKVQRQE